MKTRTHFVITEWDWFTLQLQIHSLEFRSEMYSIYFKFKPEEEIKVICMIYGKQAQVMKEQQKSKEEQLTYYEDWIDLEKRNIAETLEMVPVLRKKFDLARHVQFKIMYHYGMGGSTICEFLGERITWKI